MTFEEKVALYRKEQAAKDKLFVRKAVLKSTRYKDADGFPMLTCATGETAPALVESGHWQIVPLETAPPAAVKEILNGKK